MSLRDQVKGRSFHARGYDPPSTATLSDIVRSVQASRPPAVWLHDGGGIVAWGEFARIDPGTGPRRFQRAGEMLAELFSGLEVDDELGFPGTSALALGCFTFDERAGGSFLVIPHTVIGRRAERWWISTPAGEPAPLLRPSPTDLVGAEVRYAGSSVSEVKWLDSVAAAVAGIKSHELDKVVLARDLLVRSKTEFDIGLILERLAARFPECFTFHLDGFVGATPELLIRRMGGSLESRVLAGSAPRDEDAVVDRAAGLELKRSPKERAEHMFALGSVTDALRAHCSVLEVDEEPWLLRLANVQHLATSVTGELSGEPTALELAGELHPTAAVCGVPKEAALERIRSSEGLDRKLYSGPVGWVDARGDGEWGIALRCAELKGNSGRLFAGAGIMAESLPEKELEETRLKLKAMQSVLGR